jgi:aminomethyltransferase
MPTSAAAGEPRRTPLYDVHVAANAKMVDFAGWMMPVRYSGDLDEHRAVRSTAGLFDVSHMGEFRVRGPGALAYLQKLTPNDVAKLEPGRAHYSGLLTDDATYVDDLLIYQLAPEDYLVVVNAGNIAGDFAWMAAEAHPDCDLENVSDSYALLALQGPKAVAILASLTAADLSAIRYYGFAQGQSVANVPALISRTGYTGEDGFELYLAPEHAAQVWQKLLEVGGPAGLIPAGLGARDTLRLEAGMALYGHEIDLQTTPYEAGLGWVVKLNKGEFRGRQALQRQKEQGPAKKLIGLEMIDRGIARQGYPVVHGDQVVGQICSGTFAPTLEKAIATAYVPSALAVPGTEIEIEIRAKRLKAVVKSLPFYKRPAA